MARYLLLDSQVLQFLGGNPDFRRRRANSDRVNYNFVPVISTADTKRFSESVLDRVRSNQVSLKILVQVRLCEAVPPNSTSPTCHIEVKAVGKRHIFHDLWSKTQGHVKLNLHISDFCVRDNQGYVQSTTPVSLNWEDHELHRAPCFFPASNSRRTASMMLLYTSLFSFVCPAAIVNWWRNEQSFTAKFTISVAVRNLPVSQQLILRNRKMFQESIETDMYLVSKDKQSVKCHRAMLAASSDVLQKKLELQAGNEEVDMMKHLSFKAINVLLAYMYYGDVSEVNTSIEFALIILEAALEFQLVGLISHVYTYLKLKPCNEFTAGDAVKLYLIVKSSSKENNAVESDGNDDGDDVESDIASEIGERNEENQSQARENENEQDNRISGEDNGILEADNEISEDDNENETEAERDNSIGTSKGTTVETPKRKYDDNNGDGIDKRQRVETALGNQRDENLPGFSGNSSGTMTNRNTDRETNGVTPNNLYWDDENHMNDFLHYRKLLEEQADKLFLWYLRDNSEDLFSELESQRQQWCVKWPIEVVDALMLMFRLIQQQQRETISRPVVEKLCKFFGKLV